MQKAKSSAGKNVPKKSNRPAISQGQRRFVSVSAALIILLGIIVYSNSFVCSFHFDDFANIRDNPEIKDLSNVSAWWNYSPSRPVGTFTFALNYYFNRLDVWGYHLVNLCIHLINALLVFALMRLTLKTPLLKEKSASPFAKYLPLLAALLFVAHPLATQSVTYIVQRLASLATLFYLTSLFMYVKGRLFVGGRKSRIFLFCGSALAAVLGMMTKEITFTLPLIIVLYEFSFIRTGKIKIKLTDWRIYAAAALVIFGGVLFFMNFGMSVFKDIQPEQGNLYYLTAGTYLLTQFRVLVTYLRLLLVPVDQNLDYDYPISSNFFEINTLASFLLLAAIIVAGVLLFRKYRLLSFGIFWFFITIAIESSFIPIVNVIFEHRTYLPGIGFFIFLTGILLYIPASYQKALLAVLGIVVIINSWLTFDRNKIWKDEVTLYTDVLKKSPEKPRALVNMGLSLYWAGRSDEALPFLNRGIQRNPDWELPYYNRGVIAMEKGDYAGSLKDYMKAITLKPDYYGAYNNIAIVKYEMGDTTGALKAIEESLKIYDKFAIGYCTRGMLKTNLGKPLEAMPDFDRAISLDPDYSNAFHNRGIAKYKLKDMPGACADWNVSAAMGNAQSKEFLNRFCR